MMNLNLPSFGDYKMLKKIGSGGMASIFLAKKKGVEGFEKLVVIKKLFENFAQNEEFISMFINEAKIASCINHPNIVQIFELNRTIDSFYIVMEYVMGKDLRQVLLRSIEKRLSLYPICLRFVSEIALGLDYAHNATDIRNKPLNIVHRDVSPQNVIISYEGNVKITDFGIAKAAIESSEQTRIGILKGKVSYMSPEQAWGRESVDKRSDVFSLGIILYELITLKKCFKGKTSIEILQKIRNSDFVPTKLIKPDLPDAVNHILRKALEKDINKRYQSGSEMAEEIEKFIVKDNIPKRFMNKKEFLFTLFSEEITREREEIAKLAEEVTEKISEVQTEQIQEKITLGVEKFGRAPKPKRRVSVFKYLFQAVLLLILILGGLWYLFPQRYDVFIDVLPLINDKVKTTLKNRPMGITYFDISINSEDYKYVMKKYNKVFYPRHFSFPVKIMPENAYLDIKIKIDSKPVHLIKMTDKNYLRFESIHNTFQISIESPGFFPYEKVLYDLYNDSRPLTVELLPEKFSLHVMCVPKDVQVYINDELKANSTPADISLENFQMNDVISVTITNLYYETYNSTKVIDKSTIFLDEKLKRLEKEIGFKVVPSGEIYVDDTRIGKSTGKFVRVNLEFGNHKLQIFNQKENYNKIVKLTIDNKSKLNYTFYIPRKKGTLQIITIPPGARVFVDNELIGNSPQEISLSEGKHVIRLVQGEVIHEEPVKIQSGKTHKFIHNF